MLRLEGDSDRGDPGPGCPVITSDPTDQSSFTNDSSSCSTNSSSSGTGRSEITSTRAKTVVKANSSDNHKPQSSALLKTWASCKIFNTELYNTMYWYLALV